MTSYAGLDVCDKSTHICVVDGAGAILRRDVVASFPEGLSKWLREHCADLERVVLETGSLSTFLYHRLAERRVPAICICARHAKKALSARVNISDVNDAKSLAQLCRTGWFKMVHMKAGAAHIDRAALRVTRAAGQIAQLHGDPASRYAQAARPSHGPGHHVMRRRYQGSNVVCRPRRQPLAIGPLTGK